MEGDVGEETKRRTYKMIITNPDWLDLPEPTATNIILEHLDADDYIRFSAVCKKWHSIQKGHRIQCSPYPPPLPLTFPWLRCSRLYSEYGMAIQFYLPNKQKYYKIPLYDSPMIVKASGCNDGWQSGYGNGWLVLLFKVNGYHQSGCILNPITGVQIQLPIFNTLICAAFILSPPSDPDCTIVMLAYDEKVYLYRANDNNGLIKTGYSINDLCTPMFCHNKIYYVACCNELCIVDALLPNPVERKIEMDCLEICADIYDERFNLVDFLGELVMVVPVYDEPKGICVDPIKEFQLYKADFSTNKWVRMESLGDQALFYGYHTIFLLPAVDVGCKKNTIYTVDGFEDKGVAWKAFELSTKNWLDGPPMALPSNNYYPNGRWSWFLPTLDYYRFDERMEPIKFS